jgi:hypothetical protein
MNKHDVIDDIVDDFFKQAWEEVMMEVVTSWRLFTTVFDRSHRNARTATRFVKNTLKQNFNRCGIKNYEIRTRRKNYGHDIYVHVRCKDLKCTFQFKV